ncbi:hypothetical protein, partial [Klebsiella quasipneumoniae]|uniref:hypothetical protein n=1 Tax=Klebsiella quasipneumoniae TaxID=1463165 RepID=UPI002005F9B4
VSTPGGLRYYRLRVRRPDNSLDTAAPLAVQSDPATAGQPLLFPNPAGAGQRGFGCNFQLVLRAAWCFPSSMLLAGGTAFSRSTTNQD